MRKMTKLETVRFFAEILITKFMVKIGAAIGLIKAETSEFNGGRHTTYKNRKGEIIYEERVF